MGSSASKPAPSLRNSTPDINEKQQTAIQRLERLSLAASSTSPSASINMAAVKEWDRVFHDQPFSSFRQTVLSKQDALKAIVSREAVISDEPVFNVRIPNEISPITDQKSSGRCWLFATTNVARIHVAKNLNLEDIQLSQSYLFFWDCLEKANYYLENMIELAEEPLDSRIVQYLNQMPENDGGQWDMAVNLVARYGLVPEAVYPESYNSSNSSKLDSFLTSKLREYSLELRQLYARAMTESGEHFAVHACRIHKSKQLQEIYNILSISLGTPPQADEKFTWEYYDKNKKLHTIKTTPLAFAENEAKGFKPDDHISLINDPRNDYSKAYTVQRLGNVCGGRPVRYVNTSAARLRDSIVAVLKKGQPVWFGCDVGQFSDSQIGIMDPKLYDFKNAFGTSKNMSKSERLQSGDSAMTHAMVIVAAHVVDGEPVRFRVENSWSSSVGDKGYFVATADWVDEYVYQVVADRALLPKDLVALYEQEGVVELAAWDPLGSLA